MIDAEQLAPISEVKEHLRMLSSSPPEEQWLKTAISTAIRAFSNYLNRSIRTAADANDPDALIVIDADALSINNIYQDNRITRQELTAAVSVFVSTLYEHRETHNNGKMLTDGIFNSHAQLGVMLHPYRSYVCPPDV